MTIELWRAVYDEQIAEAVRLEAKAKTVKTARARERLLRDAQDCRWLANAALRDPATIGARVRPTIEKAIEAARMSLAPGERTGAWSTSLPCSGRGRDGEGAIEVLLYVPRQPKRCWLVDRHGAKVVQPL